MRKSSKSIIGERFGKLTALYGTDRIDNDNGYFPGNVRWATQEQQSNNRRKACSIDNFTEDEFQIEADRRGYVLVRKEAHAN